MIKKKLSLFLLIYAFVVSAIPAQTKLNYPKPRKVDQVDNYHGTKVSDPYRWMEDAPLNADTQAWIESENQLTDSYFSSINAEREAIKARLTELWNYERYSAPSKVAEGFYIYSKNDGLQNQSALYRATSISDPGKVFFDPNKLSTDGTAALNGSSFSEDGKLWAYGIARSGSDRTEWKVMNVSTGEHLPDTLRPNRQGGISWLNDNSGFYYSRFPDAKVGAELKSENYFQKLYFHKLGTPQDEDYVVYERPDNKEYFVGGGVSEDGNWLVISVGKGTERMNMVYFKNLTMEKAGVLPLVTNLQNSYSFIGNDGSVFYFRTDKDAPRSKVVKVDVLAKEPVWTDVVPESAETLNGVGFINDQLVLNYLQDAHTMIKIYEPSGKFVREVQLPGIGSAGGFGGKRADS